MKYKQVVFTSLLALASSAALAGTKQADIGTSSKRVPAHAGPLFACSSAKGDFQIKDEELSLGSEVTPSVMNLAFGRQITEDDRKIDFGYFVKADGAKKMLAKETFGDGPLQTFYQKVKLVPYGKKASSASEWTVHMICSQEGD